MNNLSKEEKYAPQHAGLEKWQVDGIMQDLGFSKEARHASEKYRGEVAQGYDTKREKQTKWHEENRIVREFLSGLPQGTNILDVPVGTGRFIPLYEELGFSVLGLDISEDMLREASQKAQSDNTYLRQGNALEIDQPDKSFDVAVCIRLFRWISTQEVGQVLRELQRVASNRVIFNARVCSHPYERPLSLLLANIQDPWRVVAVDAIERNFLMFMLAYQSPIWPITGMVEKPGA